MLYHINKDNAAAHRGLIETMHRDRKRVFVDLLRWDLEHDGQHERDQFDDDHADYIVLQDRITGEHRASLRLLQTVRPHLMSEVFGHLCEESVPASASIREITRFCVAPHGTASQRRLARNMLVRAMVDYALLTKISSFTAVCNMAFLSEVLSAGWRCRPMGMPQFVDGALIGALQIEIDTRTIVSLNANWSCQPVELRLASSVTALAA